MENKSNPNQTDLILDLPYTEFIYVEGDIFLMGREDKEALDREKPIHQVQLDSYFIGQYPVTQALWQEIMGNNPSRFPNDKHPVERVSWNDIQDFLKKLNTQTGKTYRLPTEAEWEYAARGGNQSLGYKYAGSDNLDDVAWYGDNSYGATKPVGLKYPNELGIYDMSGNVFDWCHDWYDEAYYAACHKQGVVSNPSGPSKGSRRVIRGGSWSITAGYCRVADRNRYEPSDRYSDLGFRLVLSLQGGG